jgi:peptidylprolyl isomerase
LANCGFYNGTTFHRVIPGFMVQGGDILSRDGNRLNDGSGGPGYTVRAEFNQTPHEPGIVSTARRGDDIHSAGSQFFICVAKTAHLDGQYTVFARVIEGMEVVYNIANVDRDPATDNPFERVIMKRVYVIPRTAQ